MTRKRIIALAAIALALLVLPACFDTLSQPERENPADPDNPATSSGVPPRPSGLGAVVSDRNVVLTWSVTSTTNVDHYRVYRWVVEDEEDEDYELLDTSEVATYEDGAVTNGREYRYKISAVNELGLEGKLSREHIVIPRLFSVAIEAGRPKTGSRDVTLTLSAVGAAQLMQVSNSDDMSSVPWVSYQSTYSWELTQGDGEKFVYARFRDVEDNESHVVSDAIVLDTQAAIEDLTEDSGGETQFVGDVVHFSMDAGEPFGTASVDISTAVTDVALYDDGTGGDAVQDDGVYERDYTIPPGLEIIDATVVGHFTDEVGNEADDAFADGTITIHDPPAPSTMHGPVPLSQRRIALSWTRSTDADFEEYRLYRSYVPGVEMSDEREMIYEGQNAAQTDYTDTGLEPDSTYYYAVYVVDEIGLSEISNEVFGTTLPNSPPEPVEMYAPWAPDSTSLMLSWSQSEEEDFRRYELWGWEQDPPEPPDSDTKRVIARFDSAEETFYTHSSLIDTLVYWYEVAVVDSFGATAVSDSVSGSPRE
ncbi:MAG: hypothetical protein GF400_08250 [Candidatus Eisenbacteria bacterium]|nr:hypothetical protein [Candidatus Eisenbacteria bacterium]